LKVNASTNSAKMATVKKYLSVVAFIFFLQSNIFGGARLRRSFL
jgi:hypothetical protein